MTGSKEQGTDWLGSLKVNDGYTGVAGAWRAPVKSKGAVARSTAVYGLETIAITKRQV